MIVQNNFEEERRTKIRNKKTAVKENLDILHVDNQIKNLFKKELLKLCDYKKRINSIFDTLSNSSIPFGIDEKIINEVNNSKKIRFNDISLSYREYIDLYEMYKKLQTKINNIESGLLYQKYISLTENIVNEYKSIISTPTKNNFFCKKGNKDSNIKDCDKKRKKDILDIFIKIAKNFIDINENIEIEKEKYKCYCGNNKDFEFSEGSMICENCGVEIPSISIQTSFKDIDRINMHQKYRYEKKSHFKEAVLQFQGKQNKYIPEFIFKKADEWLIIHGLIDENVKDVNKRYENVTKQHIRLFMSESEDPKITKHYEDLNLIYSKITSKPCPDIGHLEEKLFVQFDKFVEAFLSLKDIDRTNILNSQFMLKKLLLLNNYNVDPQDFPGLKTSSRQTEHEELYSKMLELTNFNEN